MDTWSLILAGLGIAMILEGLPYFISPSGVRKYISHLSAMRDGSLRLIGLIMMLGGLIVAYVSLN